MLAGKEASMDGEALLCRSTQTCCGGDRGRHVAQSSSHAVWGRYQHGNRLDATGGPDRQRCSRPDGRSQAEDDFRGARGRIRAGDFTLRGLVAELGGRGLKVDYRSVWEFVHAEKLSFKKSVVAGERDRPDVARPMDKVSRPRRT